MTDVSRGYRMTARAEATAATAARILDAAVALFYDRPTDQIVLAEVAERAGVTVQTVLRRFGSKEGLFAAGAEWGAARVAASRDVVPDDLEHAVTSLLDHYEAVGQGVLRMLAAAEGSPAIAAIVADGRAFHRQWCAASFPSTLAGLSGVRRERRLAQLVAVCDIFTWKLLHLDAGLSRRQTHLALIELLGPLLVPSGEPR